MFVVGGPGAGLRVLLQQRPQRVRPVQHRPHGVGGVEGRVLAPAGPAPANPPRPGPPHAPQSSRCQARQYEYLWEVIIIYHTDKYNNVRSDNRMREVWRMFPTCSSSSMAAAVCLSSQCRTDWQNWLPGANYCQRENCSGVTPSDW